MKKDGNLNRLFDKNYKIKGTEIYRTLFLRFVKI